MHLDKPRPDRHLECEGMRLLPHICNKLRTISGYPMFVLRFSDCSASGRLHATLRKRQMSQTYAELHVPSRVRLSCRHVRRAFEICEPANTVENSHKVIFAFACHNPVAKIISAGCICVESSVSYHSAGKRRQATRTITAAATPADTTTDLKQLFQGALEIPQKQGGISVPQATTPTLSKPQGLDTSKVPAPSNADQGKHSNSTRVFA